MTTTNTMPTSSSSADDLLFGKRLLWVQYPSTHQWWPALKFDNAAQALRILLEDLSTPQKSHLTCKYILHPTTPIAHLIGTKKFVFLSPTIPTKEFYKEMEHIYTSNELAEPMKIVTEYLQRDMESTGQGEDVAGTSSDDEEEEEEEEDESLDIDTQDSWENIWKKLRQLGWRKKTTKKGNTCWVFPGASRSNGIHGQDYFNTLEEVQEYVRKEYGWTGQAAEEEEEESSKPKKSKSAVAGNKRRRDAPLEKKQKDEGRIWGRPKKPRITVPSTPEDQATKPQDPAAPRLDDSSSEEEENAYDWNPLWDKLKAEGWIAVKAGKYNILHDWYYVRPRRSVAEGELGKDYFCSTTDVIMFCRRQDEQGAFADSPVIMKSPRKKSRKIKAAPAPSTQKTSSAIVSKKAATTKKKKAKPALPPKKQWWFHDEALPSFREVWAILQRKLGFRYSNGCYKLPFGDEIFATDLDMRKHLVEHGIPNLDRADNDEATILLRWVTFLHVPVKDTNSTIKLEDMQELSNQEATYVLVNQLGFRQDNNGSFHRGETESFDSLEEARVYFRAADSLAPPVQGRRRSKGSAVEMSDHQVLEFRLWAALCPAPLPVFPSLDEDASTTPTKKNGRYTEQEESADADTESMLDVNDKEEEPPSPKQYAKTKGASESAKKNKFDDDTFEYNDENEHAGPSYPSIRVSLSPHHSGPLTQLEE